MMGYETAFKYLKLDGYTGDLTWRFSRPKAPLGSKVGTVRYDGYRIFTLHGKMYYTHRVVWLMHYGRWPNGDIDHLDGNRLNNCISNLRECDDSINQKNRNKSKNNTSGYTGVYFDKSRNCFRARYISRGKQIYVGQFDSAEEANEALTKARISDGGFTKRHGI